MPPVPKAKFADGEKLLCYHGPILYEAKCVRAKRDGNQCYYFVHYQGWNQKWDEWVDESEVLKINPENLEKKERLLASQRSALKESKKKPSIKSMGPDSANTSRASTPVSDRSFKVGPSLDKGSAVKRIQTDDERSTSSREDEPSSSRRSINSKKAKLSARPTGKGGGGGGGGGGGSKTEEDSDQDEKSESGNEGKVKVSIPDELKYVLVSDWDLVTHKKKLFSLPAKVTIASILSDWVKHVETSVASNPSLAAKMAKIAAATEIAAGIRQFFDAFVEKHLLYGIERRQHRDVVVESEDSKCLSEIYGSAHLLRLMTKIGGFLDRFKVSGDGSGIRLIENSICDLLKHLESNRGKLFTSKNYIEAPEEYTRPP